MKTAHYLILSTMRPKSILMIQAQKKAASQLVSICGAQETQQADYLVLIPHQIGEVIDGMQCHLLILV